MGSDVVGSEHLLLGILRSGDQRAARVLAEMGVAIEDARIAAQPTLIDGQGHSEPAGKDGISAYARSVLEQSLREAIARGEGHIGVEHLLLALLREEVGGAARTLAELGVDPDVVRERLAGTTRTERRTVRSARRGRASGGAGPGHHHRRDRHRGVQRVVELVRLQRARRRDHVHRLRHPGRVERAVRVGARRRAHAELEGLRRRREAAGLVGAEAVLARQHDRERPAGRRRAAERGLRDPEGDVARERVGVDRDRADRRAARVDEPLAEALHLEQAAPRAGRGDRVVALRERRRGRGRRRGRVVDVDVDQLRPERAPERGGEVAGAHAGTRRRRRGRRPGTAGGRRRPRGIAGSVG